MDEPQTPYDAEHIRDALIHDPRVSELDVHVRLVNDTLVVTGNVATEQRRDAITRVVTELVGDAEIRNDVTVTDLSAPSGQEVVS
jgi:osmotically-inducible protein OsmY